MTRLRLALACFVVASVAVAAPVPKTIRPEPIRLSGPRPLMIRTAVVEESELKLTRDERDHDPDSALLRDVTATDRDGKLLDAKTLTAKLTKPTLVVVTTFETPDAHGKDAPKVDDGDDWRRVLADDVIIIDGKAFKYGWREGFYDVLLSPVRVEGQRVTTTRLTHFGFKNLWSAHEAEHMLDPDELLEVDSKEWAEWVRWNKQRGVAIDLQRGKRTPEEHQNLFRDFYLGGETPHYSRPLYLPPIPAVALPRPICN